MYCKDKISKHDKIGGWSNIYRLHIQALFQFPHDIVDILLEVRPPVQVNIMRFACSIAPREYLTYVASRSSRSRAEGGIVVGTRDVERDISCKWQLIGVPESIESMGSCCPQAKVLLSSGNLNL